MLILKLKNWSAFFYIILGLLSKSKLEQKISQSFLKLSFNEGTYVILLMSESHLVLGG